jgi:lipid-binding SYLF domain-containing protein
MHNAANCRTIALHIGFRAMINRHTMRASPIEEMLMHYQAMRNTALALFTLWLCGCMAAGQTTEDKKRNVENMRKEVLTELYALNPGVAEEIKNAPGYAVFSNKNLTLIFPSGGYGYGVVVDNANDKHTYMRMGTGGVGFGLGYKDYRAVYIFEKRHMLESFLEQGFTVAGQGAAAAQASSQGAGASGQLILDGIKVYQITEAGLVLDATIQGSKYWKDADLN